MNYVERELIKIMKNVFPYGIINNINKTNSVLETGEPEIYSSSGTRYRVFYLKDDTCVHEPYSFVHGRLSKFIFWDRFNEGLPIHFYTHEHIFDKINPNKRNFAILNEAESVLGDLYSEVIKNRKKIERFDAVFTFSEKVLSAYQNAYFLPSQGVWYGTETNGGTTDPNVLRNKTKNISMVSSSKCICRMHVVRHKIAKQVYGNKLVDGFGDFFNNHIDKKADSLNDYRFSIVVENDIKPFYFTEKILDCFASMVIPIYIGATRINDFFNSEGIIKVKKKDINHIDSILKECNSEYYDKHFDAVMDNYIRVKNYLSLEDYMYNKYNSILF